VSAPHLRRLAAVTALLAPPAMVVLVAVALAGDVAVALGAVALVLLASSTIWLALTNRGARRAVGVAGTLLFGAGLLVLLVANWQGIVVLLALVALLALFGASARHALEGGAPTAEPGHEDAAAGAPGGGGPLGVRAGARTVGAADAAVLIINPRSGGGKAERFELAAEARRRGIEPVVLVPGDDLLELANDAIERGADVIGMAGGDGSQALVATVASSRGVPHVCIPAGTRNHFALDLGLDRDDVVAALEAFTDGVERRIDLARVNDRVFVNNASLGVYAKVVQSNAYRDAKLETWTRMLPDLLGPEAAAIDLRLQGPGGVPVHEASLVLVSNNPYRLTHLAGVGTRERLDSGLLGVVAARIGGAAEAARFVAAELMGRPERFPGLQSFTTPEIEVDSGAPVEVGLDGEALVLEPPLRFVSLPGALRVRVPSSAGRPPGTRAVGLTGESLGALLDVAAGR